MRSERVPPKPPPTEFRLTFSRDDGWALVAALLDYADNHPAAAHRDDWKRWARELDVLLRSEP